MFAALYRMLPAAAVVAAGWSGGSATAEVTPFALSLAAAASEDAEVAAYYREAGYDPLWTGSDPADRARRAALLRAVGRADLHGLPAERYEVDRLLSEAVSHRERGRVEVALTRTFLRYAEDLHGGLLSPGAVVPEIKRTRPSLDRGALLRRLERARPHRFMDALAPQGAEYTRLMRARLELEAAIREESWGEPVRVPRLERGDSGPEVVALRDRLVALGYLDRSSASRFDERIAQAVEAFQADHGLATDGIVGNRTLGELNASPVRRLGQVLVALERERWMNIDRGARHVWVNLADFRTRLMVEGETVFETKSVIGEREHQTPEFSDTMEHMVINPYWYVPRSIVVEEYLPDLRRNPRAHGQLQILDRSGRVVSRNRSFAGFSAQSFPYTMRQEPGPQNALGRVKFMFPNRYSIYLHDTPAQHLFAQPVRAFSHGCIRLDDPYDFAEELLRLDGDPDPRGTFERHLASGDNRKVALSQPLPVHLVYRTAMGKPGGGMEYRGDIYGRDARILDALMTEGVRLPGIDRRLALSGVAD